MDKYQEFILRQVYPLNADCTVNCFTSEKSGRQDCGVLDFNKNVITVTQDEDIFSTVYKHTIKKTYTERISRSEITRTEDCRTRYSEVWSTDYLSGVEVTRDGVNWEEIANVENGYQIILDFNDRIKKVKFKFVNGLADDYVMDVVYVEADKEEYYRNKAEEEDRARISALVEKANIRVATGASLVNIYFSPCCENYVRTEIELYAGGNLMARYKVPEEQYFKSIDGLAQGGYTFILKQYGKDGKILFQTDETAFGIKKPNSGPYDANL